MIENTRERERERERTRDKATTSMIERSKKISIYIYIYIYVYIEREKKERDKEEGTVIDMYIERATEMTDSEIFRLLGALRLPLFCECVQLGVCVCVGVSFGGQMRPLAAILSAHLFGPLVGVLPLDHCLD